MTAVRYTYFVDAPADAGPEAQHVLDDHAEARDRARYRLTVSHRGASSVVRVTTDEEGDDDAGRPMVAVAGGGTGSGVHEGVQEPSPGAFAAPARGGDTDGRPHHPPSVAVAVSSTVPPFQDFLEANRATVYRFLTVAVGPGDADDCFQETFLAALRAYPRVTRGERLDRWILRIASRKAIDHHRAIARHAVPTAEPPERVAPRSTRRRTTNCGRRSAGCRPASGWRWCTGTYRTCRIPRSRS